MADAVDQHGLAFEDNKGAGDSTGQGGQDGKETSGGGEGHEASFLLRRLMVTSAA